LHGEIGCAGIRPAGVNFDRYTQRLRNILAKENKEDVDLPLPHSAGDNEQIRSRGMASHAGGRSTVAELGS
jgi:hypothetical protein